MLRFPQLFEGDCEGWSDDLTVSMLRDAAKQVPALAELAAPIIHEDAPLIDADIGIQWCQRPDIIERVTSKFPKQLAELLDRVANTEAKTDRGREIKSRLAPTSDAEQLEL